MPKLTIVASLIAKADQVELVQAELTGLVAKTHAEDEGCISYDLHVDNENPTHFVVLENWESAELLQKHIDSDHFKACMAATENAVESFTVNQLTHIA